MSKNSNFLFQLLTVYPLYFQVQQHMSAQNKNTYYQIRLKYYFFRTNFILTCGTIQDFQMNLSVAYPLITPKPSV